MIRWHYRSTTVFGVGLLFALLAILTVTGASLAQNQPPAHSSEWEYLFGHTLLVRQPDSPALEDILAGRTAANPAFLPDPAGCLALLCAAPEVTTAFPLHAARVVLRDDLPELSIIGEITVLGVSPEAREYFRHRLFPEQNQPDLVFAGRLVLPASFMTALKNSFPKAGTPETRFYLDARQAADSFNLTPVTLAGGYTLPEAHLLPQIPPLGWTGAEDLLRCTRKSLLASPPPLSGGTTDGRSSEEDPFLVDMTRGTPLDYSFLFSLNAQEPELPDPVSPVPYLLVEINPAQWASRDEFCRLINQKLAEKDGHVLVEPTLSGSVPAAGPVPWLFPVIPGIVFLLVVMLANLFFRPVPKTAHTAQEETASPDPRSWRPSLISRNFFIAITFGAAGTLWGLAVIPLYNVMAPTDMKQFLSRVCQTSLEHLTVPPIGLLVVAGFIILFTLLTLPGPVARARTISRQLLHLSPPQASPKDSFSREGPSQEKSDGQ